MSGSNSFAPGSADRPEGGPPEPLSFTVHTMPRPSVDADRRTRAGRLKMLLVLLVCAAPVIASYFTYYVIRPEGRTNYGELILPQRPLPEALPLRDLQGQPVAATSLKDQWLLVVVAGGACDERCERHLYLQRQLRETLGKDRDRLDKVWFVTDEAAVRPEVLQAIPGAQVLRVPQESLAEWLAPAEGRQLPDHLYVVDPLGNWMMRFPAEADANKVKRDLAKLMRASASWDRPGR
ncbi:SCO family protein [Caldimonas thermodepolymerans]|uniref:Cytochrome oxidase Cu insertion factor (SCO1/SenC/PrrC family) n=1 Tax=Caldimonas thermodepolymerans TaxID=215580 RepID=A0AA46HWY8_9BURK|nr:hypothetical protein [Caldimonas thermodepolymerans]TCP09006.1 cytochrome oxidase Cu insertion factor (SCO1/SenC/PrrC family) [Caldimonas thermodepolymerans]UZG43641.1 hypothetical protein ONZ46_14790 [Caldimonas thermodepolymerans]UZG47306.1 hypothetical protein ONS87_15425 [Caldimonas thermodepolymerans]